MAALTEELDRRASATACVSLVAHGPAPFLYEKFGFAGTATPTRSACTASPPNGGRPAHHRRSSGP